MSDQPPLPGRPPAWKSEDEPTLAYPVPNHHDGPRPQQQQQQPYDGPQPPQHPQQQPSYQQPYDGQSPLSHEQRYEGQPPHPQQPRSQQLQPFGGPRPPYNPDQQVPWQQQPPSNRHPSASYQQPQQTYQQPQQTYQQPQAYYGQQQPQYMPPAGYQGGQPSAKSKKPWLLAGAIALVVALVGGAGAVVLTRSGGDDEAGTPVSTGSSTDGLASTEPSPEPTETPSNSRSAEPTPTPSPTPTERRRTLKDVDKGILVYDDVYVSPAVGWRKDRRTKYSVTLGTQSHFGAAIVIVAPVGLPARSAVQSVAQELIDADHLTGVRKEPVKTFRPANSNISTQAQLSYSGRYTAANGAVFSLVARCTSMTGVESIHNVTVTLCVAARKDTRDTVFRDGARMLASVARSI